MPCPTPDASYKCLTCPKVKNEVRASLALFAATNFLVGLLTFMFLLCSNSDHHRYHLQILFSDPLSLMDHDHPPGHYDTAN